jgi:hypothetical protein
VLGALLLTASLSGSAAVSTSAAAEPRWRFRDDTRSVKVVVLAGSIGAWQRDPYAERLESRCSAVEVVNISKAGLGAWALKKHFEEQVLGNRRIDLDDDDHEYWLIYGGGLNTVWDPSRNNHYVKNTFVKAHMAGMRVVAITVTPWGSERDKRWRGVQGLHSRRDTQRIVDFTLGRLEPAEALGSYASRRPAGADGPWDPLEVADIAIDLYDSVLRDADAPLRDLQASRRALQEDSSWRRAHREQDEDERAAALTADAQTLSEVPRWYLRPELHSFDHIHPNAEGHRLMAAVMCPQLPQSWRCRCEDSATAATAEPDAATLGPPRAQEPSVENKQPPRSPPPRFPVLRGCVRQ